MVHKEDGDESEDIELKSILESDEKDVLQDGVEDKKIEDDKEGSDKIEIMDDLNKEDSDKKIEDGGKNKKKDVIRI